MTEMTDETKEQILLRKLARYLREPGDLERRIFHTDAFDKMKAASPEDREALAAKLDALADQKQAARSDIRTDGLTPREKFLRDTTDMWRGDKAA